MSDNEETRRAFSLLVEGEAIEGERLRFFQSLVLYARDIQDAERQVAVILSRRDSFLVSIDPEETREVAPESVKLGGSIPEEGIVGMSGRIWVKPGLVRRLGSRLRKIWH